MRLAMGQVFGAIVSSSGAASDVICLPAGIGPGVLWRELERVDL